MNNKQILCTCLATLQIENEISEPITDHDVIRKALDLVRLPLYADEGDERAPLIVIKDIVKNVLEGDMKFDKPSILRTIKLETTQNKPLYNSIVEFLELEDKDTPLPEDPIERRNVLAKQSRAYYTSLRSAVSMSSVDKAMGRAFSAMKGGNEKLSAESALDELRGILNQRAERTHTKIPSLVSSINTRNSKDFIAHYDEIKEKASGHGLKTGWKKFNRMMGVMDGIGEELMLLPALPFNCKSLFSLLLSTSIPLFNDADEFMARKKKACPNLIRGDKQPVILDISLENELSVNLSHVYQAVKGHFEGVETDFKKVKSDEASEYVCNKLRKRGWEYDFQRHLNTDFEVHYLNDIISDAESKGFYVAGIRADYLGTIRRTGLGTGVAGSDIREVYRIARNIIIGRNRGFCIAPHQISPEGKKLKALDEANFITSLPGRGLYAESTTIDNEADFEVFFGKRKAGHQWLLELQRGKHRGVGIETDEKYQHFFMPFGVGILPWDYDLETEVGEYSFNAYAPGLGDMGGLDDF